VGASPELRHIEALQRLGIGSVVTSIYPSK
jgi:hypothetical protein